MGFDRLRLVNPKPFEREAVLRVAHRGDDLLDSMQIFDELDDAERLRIDDDADGAEDGGEGGADRHLGTDTR